MNVEKIALFGLGKLGLPLSLIFGQKIKVKGIDVDKNKIQNLTSLIPPFFEPNLEEYLKNSVDNVTFADSENYSIDDIDIAIILVNTPSNEKGEFSNNYIYDVIRSLSKKLKISQKKDFLIILSSTVMPGSHEDLIKTIEEESGRKINENFGFVYAPDLVALGSVIKDFENPDLLILGESDERYGIVAEKLYKKIIKNNAPIVRMSLIESEISKVSLNAYITMKISFFNFIGNVSEKFKCNSLNISKALGYDKRISPYYNKSGLAFGGTCFPRDTWAFIKMSENIGLDAVHIKSTQKINELQNKNLFEKVEYHKGKRIGVLGLSFKPDSTVVTESPGYILCEKLKSKNFNFQVYDDLIKFGYENICNDFEKIIEESEVIVITQNNKKFEELRKFNLSNKIIINPWNLNI